MLRRLLAMALLLAFGCSAPTTTGPSDEGSPKTTSRSSSERTSEKTKDTSPKKTTQKMQDFTDPG